MGAGTPAIDGDSIPARGRRAGHGARRPHARGGGARAAQLLPLHPGVDVRLPVAAPSVRIAGRRLAPPAAAGVERPVRAVRDDRRAHAYGREPALERPPGNLREIEVSFRVHGKAVRTCGDPADWTSSRARSCRRTGTTPASTSRPPRDHHDRLPPRSASRSPTSACGGLWPPRSPRWPARSPSLGWSAGRPPAAASCPPPCPATTTT